MATRSYIGIENSDNSITFAYCHYDGYPDGVGNDIVNMKRREARALINKGSMRTVGEHFDDNKGSNNTVPDRLMYGSALQGSSCEYAYLLNVHGNWLYTHRSNPYAWHSLKLTLKKEKVTV